MSLLKKKQCTQIKSMVRFHFHLCYFHLSRGWRGWGCILWNFPVKFATKSVCTGLAQGIEGKKEKMLLQTGRGWRSEGGKDVFWAGEQLGDSELGGTLLGGFLLIFGGRGLEGPGAE